eukprot:scaffold945_cov170-Amphora_coffeaeformis.AAC.13
MNNSTNVHRKAHAYKVHPTLLLSTARGRCVCQPDRSWMPGSMSIADVKKNPPAGSFQVTSSCV